MNEQQLRWNKRYEQAKTPGKIAEVLNDNQHLLPTNSRDLVAADLACGVGANALFLAKQGFQTHAFDISNVALQHLEHFAAAEQLSINTHHQDIEQNPLEANSFDILLVCHFLYRPLCKVIINALKPNGLLFYQTFTQHKVTPVGPSNPDFLLKPNELLTLFQPELSIINYREEASHGNTQIGLRNQAYLVASKS